MTQHYTLLYILGSGHCGSTLLDLLLNGHSQILGLGEIVALKRYIALAKKVPRNSPKPLQSSCRRNQLKDWIEVESHPLDTPFWQAVKRCYESIAEAPFDRIDTHHYSKWSTIRSWQTEDIESWVRPNKALLSSVHQISSRNILTDASKSPHRLYLLQRSGLFDIRVIHLLRDGRAVINSYIRKYGDFRLALRRWAAPALLAFYVRRTFAKTDWLLVRYEELATRPEDTLKTICAFLGVNFESEMLVYRNQPYFGIGGNRMREREDEHIILDEGWRQELHRKHRLAFALIAGWLNRSYGY